MTIKVTVEGGGSFEINDERVEWMRSMHSDHGPRAESHWSVVRDLANALPPEPYQPKEGDWVQYRRPQWVDWSNGTCVYLGQWRKWHVLGTGVETGTPFLENETVEFRRAET